MDANKKARKSFREFSAEPAVSLSWQTKPRILCVSASPPSLRVGLPVEENKRALRDALSAWIEPLAGAPEAIPDERNVLVLLPSASLDAIAKAGTEAAAEGKSFTIFTFLRTEPSSVKGCANASGSRRNRSRGAGRGLEGIRLSNCTVFRRGTSTVRFWLPKRWA